MDFEAGVKRYAQEVAGKEPQLIASPVRWLAAEPVRYQVPAKTYLERPLR